MLTGWRVSAGHAVRAPRLPASSTGDLNHLVRTACTRKRAHARVRASRVYCVSDLFDSPWVGRPSARMRLRLRTHLAHRDTAGVTIICWQRPHDKAARFMIYAIGHRVYLIALLLSISSAVYEEISRTDSGLYNMCIRMSGLLVIMS